MPGAGRRNEITVRTKFWSACCSGVAGKITNVTRPRDLVAVALSVGLFAPFGWSEAVGLSELRRKMLGGGESEIMGNIGHGICRDPAKRAFYRVFRDFNPLNDLGSG